MGISTTAGVKTLRTVQFLSTSAWVAPLDVTNVRATLLSGGGGGGTASNGSFAEGAGGGGGGGMITTFLTVVPNTSYTITIGAGGTASAVNTVNGTIGGTTSFGALSTILGGGGGMSTGTVQPVVVASTGGGAATGIGGGGGGMGIVPPYTSSTYANAGKVAKLGSNGSDVSFPHGNVGINGLAGGGGGGTNNASFYGLGHSGGGNGAITITTASTAGTINSGGGGGGGSSASANGIQRVGSSGGSGMAIIEYWSAF